MKAILLAAGFGTRLEPITSVIPKPLVPIVNEPLLGIALRQLTSAGFGPFAINAHHLSEKIVSFSRSLSFLVTPKVSVEVPAILGTGGAFHPLSDWIGKDAFLVYNGDILSDIDFLGLKLSHQNHHPLVTMAVRPGHNGKDNAIWIDARDPKNLNVVAIGKNAPNVPTDLRPFTYACAYVAESELLNFIPSQGEASVVDAFIKALDNGHRIRGELHNGFWADIGTPQSLMQTTKDVLNLRPRLQERLLGKLHNSRTVLGKGVTWHASAKASGVVVVGDHAQILDGADLENVIVFSGVSVGARTLQECIVVKEDLLIQL